MRAEASKQASAYSVLSFLIQDEPALFFHAVYFDPTQSYVAYCLAQTARPPASESLDYEPRQCTPSWSRNLRGGPTNTNIDDLAQYALLCISGSVALSSITWWSHEGDFTFDISLERRLFRALQSSTMGPCERRNPSVGLDCAETAEKRPPSASSGGT